MISRRSFLAIAVATLVHRVPAVPPKPQPPPPAFSDWDTGYYGWVRINLVGHATYGPAHSVEVTVA